MRPSLLALLTAASLALVGAGCATSASLPLPLTARAVAGAGAAGRYQAYVPPPSVARPLPVVLFLHGGGEMGSDNLAQTRVGLGPEIARRLARGEGFPFLVVFPQCPSPGIWTEPAVERATLAALDDAVAALGGDPRRVYLVGNSMGGFGAWALGARHPERFAAVVPVAAAVKRPGWTPFPEAARLVPRGQDPRPGVADAIARARLPVWIFSGEDDAIEPPGEGRRMLALLTERRATDAHFTAWPATGHAGTWERTYALPALWQWLLAHRRAPAPVAPVVPLAIDPPGGAAPARP